MIRKYIFVIYFLLTMVSSIAHSADYQVSFKNLGITKPERIVGFDLTFKSSFITFMNCIPAGWHFVLDNDPSGVSKIKGGVIVGAAALDANDLQELIKIRSDDSSKAIELHGEIIVTSDFEHEKHIAIDSTKFELKGGSHN